MASRKIPEDEKRTHCVMVRFNDFEYGEICDRAAKMNIPLAAYVRQQAFNHNLKITYEVVCDSETIYGLVTEYYMDGVNCSPMAFDHECEKLNEHFNKNKSHGDIRYHHYIIGIDTHQEYQCRTRQAPYGLVRQRRIYETPSFASHKPSVSTPPMLQKTASQGNGRRSFVWRLPGNAFRGIRPLLSHIPMAITIPEISIPMWS